MLPSNMVDMPVKRRLDGEVYDKMHNYYRAVFDSVADINLNNLCPNGVQTLSETMNSLPQLLDDKTTAIQDNLSFEQDEGIRSEEEKEL